MHLTKIALTRFVKLLPALSVLLISGCQEVVLQKTAKRPYNIKSVVSLSPSTTELAILDLQVSVAGRGASDNYPPNVKSYPVVMNGIHPDFEAISKSGADAVLYDVQTTNQADIDKLKKMNLVTIGIGGNTYEQYKESLYQAASLLGTESNLNDYVQGTIDQKIQQVKGNLSGTSSKVALIMPGKGSEHMIDGVNSFQADLLKKIGQTPVGPNATGFASLNVEDLLKDNPDVIVVAGDPKIVASDPRLAGLTAIKKQHVYGLNPDVALREGARVDQFVDDLGAAIQRSRS